MTGKTGTEVPPEIALPSPGTPATVVEDFSDMSDDGLSVEPQVNTLSLPLKKKREKVRVVKDMDVGSALEFRNTPLRVGNWLSRVLRGLNTDGMVFPNCGFISSTDLRVVVLPNLEICPNKTNEKTCHCVELSHGATTVFQDDVRRMYCRIIQETSRQVGNQFLMSMMVVKPEQPGVLAYRIPGFTFDGRVRMFYVCPPQFCKLFGMSTKRFYKLRRDRLLQLKEKEHVSGRSIVFGWTLGGESYVLGGKHYDAFRADSWKDYMIKHGGYSESDDLN